VLREVPLADGEVARVAELFSHVRTTNYGRWFDVRAVVDPANLAYSGLGLPAHTDNPYRDPVPTLQLLHCLQSSASGGDNVLVDGFRAAAEVRRARPAGFELLASRPVDFTYADDDTELRAAAPLIELDSLGEVRAVRCNSRSMAPPRMSAAELVDWYDAFSLWCRLLDEPRLQVRIHLEPGDLFIVDNRRVLHGRTAYDAAGGTRHLQGCYADVDGLRSTVAVLRRHLGPAAEALT
jgi:gamma-butyrobetaine dioxygenase